VKVKLSEIIAPAFYEVHQSVKRQEYDEYWEDGGRGSTKSSYISLEIVLGIVDDTEANAIIYRKVGNTLRESVFEQILWAIDVLGLSEYFKATVAPLEIRYKPTGQRIIFRGADDPGKSKSIKLRKGYFKFLWFEELAEFNGMDDVRTIKASVIRGGENAITFYSYNPPQSADNWVNAEAMVPKPNRRKHHTTYLNVPRAWLGEPFIREAEALRAQNERAYRHTYLGEVTGTGGNVFDNLQLRTITAEELNSFDKIYNGLDFGFAVDPDAFVRWAYSKKTRTLYALAEHYDVRTPTEELVEKIKRKANHEIVTCDSEDPRMIDALRRNGLHAIPAKKGPDSVNHGMRWLQELAAIVIDPKLTPNIAREFAGYEYERDKHGQFLSRFPDKNNHTIDATRYAVEVLSTERRAKTINRAKIGL